MRALVTEDTEADRLVGFGLKDGAVTTGRWRTTTPLRPGDAAFVAPGGVLDAFGETNGATSSTVGRTQPSAR